MPNITKWAASGLHANLMGKRGSSGYFAGFAGLTAANTNTASSMRLLKGAVEAASPVPTVVRSANRGENGEIARFAFKGSNPDLTFTFEGYDADLGAAMNRDTIMTEGEWDHVPEGGILSVQNMMALVIRDAVSLETDSYGTPGYENALYMSVGGRLEVGNAAYQAAGQVLAQLVANEVEKTHKGTTWLASHGKITGMVSRWFSERPCALTCFIGDNAEDEIPLGFTPISTAKTKAYLWSTGAALTVSSVNTTTDTATLSAAPASGAIVTVVYEQSDF